ncbi:hypothetical protein Sjap_006361 [Stephania japonica]|uniref:Arabinanase/levansucrase/invertase n=1 Tax=Stephania japonica TaxID=461633 RepID=A0AAP0K5P2_9MAGN
MDTATRAAAAANVLASLTNPPSALISPHRPSPTLSFAAKRNHTTTTLCSTKPNIGSTNNNNNSNTNENPTLEPHSPPPISSQFSTNPSNPSSPISSLSTTGLVFDLGAEQSSWDCREIGRPVVKRFVSDDEERWYMWYYGSSSVDGGRDSIGIAASSNGIHWERGRGAVRSSGDAGMVMSCSKDWWAFDVESIRPSEVVVMSSAKVRSSTAVYWLYYTGYSSEKVVVCEAHKALISNPDRGSVGGEDYGCVLRSLPGLAISQDGRHWARIEGEHHSGALFDVGSKSNKEWDSLFVASPQVVFHTSGDLRMYYHSFDEQTGLFSIGIARSRDGIRWVKLGKIDFVGSPSSREGCFDEFGGLNANVVRKGKDGEYVMAYEGVGVNGERSIGLAVSSDGLGDWRRYGEGPVLKPDQCSSDGDRWDGCGVGSPCLVQMDGQPNDEWRLYYRGVGKGGRSGIGMAVSVCEGGEIGSFQRWTGFHL